MLTALIESQNAIMLSFVTINEIIELKLIQSNINSIISLKKKQNSLTHQYYQVIRNLTGEKTKQYYWLERRNNQQE